jgi:hypothetical protein
MFFLRYARKRLLGIIIPYRNTATTVNVNEYLDRILYELRVVQPQAIQHCRFKFRI